jgi:hypothetical protein
LMRRARGLHEIVAVALRAAIADAPDILFVAAAGRRSLRRDGVS